jgi:hypothetical protein
MITSDHSYFMIKRIYLQLAANYAIKLIAWQDEKQEPYSFQLILLIYEITSERQVCTCAGTGTRVAISWACPWN